MRTKVLIRARVIEMPLSCAAVMKSQHGERVRLKMSLGRNICGDLSRVTLIDSASLIKSKCGIRCSCRLSRSNLHLSGNLFSHSLLDYMRASEQCYLLSPARINRWRLWPKESARTASTWEPSLCSLGLDGGGGA
jgi:hypothetical protein